MKRFLSAVLTLLVFFMYSGTAAFAIQAPQTGAKLQAAPNARSIDFAFVFDGPSDKNASLLKTFQATITRSLLPD